MPARETAVEYPVAPDRPNVAAVRVAERATMAKDFTPADLAALCKEVMSKETVFVAVTPKIGPFTPDVDVERASTETLGIIATAPVSPNKLQEHAVAFVFAAVHVNARQAALALQVREHSDQSWAVDVEKDVARRTTPGRTYCAAESRFATAETGIMLHDAIDP